MKNISVYLLLSILISFSCFSQDEILLVVNGENVPKSEFLRVYNKNSVQTTTSAMDENSLKEYLDLYVNFKLKVKEAESLGMDTTKAFLTELAGYRAQLAKPYLTDSETSEKLVKEAYNRTLEDVRASHILVNVAENATDVEAQEVYSKLMEIRKSIVAGKITFEEAAKKHSADKGSAELGGDLGFFTAFSMVYPFETAAFANKIREISLPVKTRFGYHIVKTIDRRPARGEVKVAHILMRPDEDMTDIEAKKLSNEVYASAIEGVDFRDLASQYSADRRSASNGGELPYFGIRQMISEFEDAAFALENDGDISKPVKTKYGYHIIKRIEKKVPPTFEEYKPEIKSKVLRDSRGSLDKERFLNRIKKDYNFKESNETLNYAKSLVDESIVTKTWKNELSFKKDQEIMSFANQSIGLIEFLGFIEKNQSGVTEKEKESMINAFYKKFVDEKLSAYEDTQLEKKYPEFNNLVTEYHDGILLFELTDRMVWSKAVEDSLGLDNYYQGIKSKYKWDDRLDGIIFEVANYEDAKKARKMVKKGEVSVDSVLSYFNKESVVVSISEGVYEKDLAKLENLPKSKKGVSKVFENKGKFNFVQINEVIPAGPKKLTEIRGIVTAEYQDVLEKKWISELRQKYNWSVNEDVFNSLIEN
jgi:peptidyl-prolyl cis-trans isomerase SurA